MDSGMISKIQKARRYAQEPGRVSFETFSVQFEGDNSTHQVTYDGGKWHCSCGFYEQRGVCSHIMAMERILGAMVTLDEPVEV